LVPGCERYPIPGYEHQSILLGTFYSQGQRDGFLIFYLTLKSLIGTTYFSRARLFLNLLQSHLDYKLTHLRVQALQIQMGIRKLEWQRLASGMLELAQVQPMIAQVNPGSDLSCELKVAKLTHFIYKSKDGLMSIRPQVFIYNSTHHGLLISSLPTACRKQYRSQGLRHRDFDISISREMSDK
jgi:hypothetical protein